MLKPISILTAMAILSACTAHVQRTSGAGYLERYDAQTAAAKPIRASDRSSERTKDLDPAIWEAAAIEPILTLPARIGLARIENGQLSPIPATEAMAWKRLAHKNAGLGQFVPADPLIAYATAHSIAGLTLDRWNEDVGKAINVIRLGAARQHMDAILIYEVGAQAQKENTFLAFADLTVIGGAFLPTRAIEGTGVARALLLDVRNGYPYGTANSSTEFSTLSTSWGSDASLQNATKAASTQVALDLIPEVEKMIKLLMDGDPKKLADAS